MELQKLTLKWYTLLSSNPQFDDLRINSENYAIEIKPIDVHEKEFYDLRGNISGGNRTLLAVAERLALAQKTKSTIILLDEPTDGTDIDNVNSEIIALSRLAQKLEQVIMVTHHQKGYEYANNIITLVKNMNTNETKISEQREK